VGLVSAEIIDFGELCLLAVIRDITDHKQAEEVLLRAKWRRQLSKHSRKKSSPASGGRHCSVREKFSKAFRSSLTPSRLARDGRYVEVNDSCLRLLGYHREEVIGHTSIELNIWANQGSYQNATDFAATGAIHPGI